VEPTSFSVIMDNHSVGVNLDRIRNADPTSTASGLRSTTGPTISPCKDPNKVLLAAAMARAAKGGRRRPQGPHARKVVKLLVDEGETVEEGQPLLILEAMKMQNEYVVQPTGTVGRIHVEEGSVLEINAP